MWHPDTPIAYRNAITVGDAWQLAAHLPDRSIDLVFADPIYAETDFYRRLAELAMRVLREDGRLLAFTSKPNLTNVRQAMEAEGLRFVYWLDYVVEAKVQTLQGYGLYTWTTPCLWMCKPDNGGFKTYRKMPDTFIGHAGDVSSDHKWNKSEPVILRWLEAMTRPGAAVLDPCCGSGPIPAAARMLGRRYIAFERDISTAWGAIRRVDRARLMTVRQQRMDMEKLATEQLGLMLPSEEEVSV